MVTSGRNTEVVRRCSSKNADFIPFHWLKDTFDTHGNEMIEAEFFLLQIVLLSAKILWIKQLAHQCNYGCSWPYKSKTCLQVHETRAI